MTNRFQINRKFLHELLIWMIWTQTILMQYVRAAVMRFPIIGAYPDAVITIIYVIVIIIALPEIKVTAHDFLFVLGFTVLFIIESLFRGQDNSYLAAYFPNFLLTTLSLYLIGVSLTADDNENGIIRHLYILSILTIILNFLYKVVFGTPMDAIMSQYQGDMNLAYNLLPHCCLVSYYARKKPNVINVSLTIFSAFYLLMLGTRGAALIMLICIAWNLVTVRDSRKTIVKIVALFGTVAAFLSSSLYNTFILWMYQMAQKMGLSIRIFDKLLAGTEMGSSGRDGITEKLFVSINDHFLLGSGLCSDRMIVGIYAHNILVELWVEFGVIIGSLILGILIYTLLRGFMSSDRGGERGLIMALICSSFLKLFLSGSYMDDKMLFLLIGLCVGAIRKSKYKNFAEDV